jgi:hypothetical protein
MREILMHFNLKLQDIFKLDPKVPGEQGELARLRNLKH